MTSSGWGVGISPVACTAPGRSVSGRDSRERILCDMELSAERPQISTQGLQVAHGQPAVIGNDRELCST
jgi:murein tripeptide amidase MpaA